MQNEKSPLKNIFLTFDDGPSEPYTSQILDILKKFGAKATFFVCGKSVEKFPEIAKRIVEEGHTIGNHTYSHLRIHTLSHSRILTPFLVKEIEKTTGVIQKVTGVRTKFFRPPWGFVTPWLKKYLEENNYKVILWDIQTYDWKGPPIKVIEENIFKKIKPDSIILLHDGNEGKFHCDRSQTVFALPFIIKKLKEQGYILKDIGELRTQLLRQ
jgi:peptidoglycan/xylan/chitin deacetylase (PgdA/CDA1 family)